MPHGFGDQRFEVVQRRARAQGREQIHFVFAQEAHAEFAIGGEARAGAGRAERLGHGTDEAQVAEAVREAVEAGFAVELAAVHRDQRPERGFDLLPHLPRGDDLRLLEPGHIAEGHHFDEAHLPVMVERERGEVHHVVFVVPPDDHCVEFDRQQPGGLGLHDAVPHVLHVAPAGEALELRGIERINRDVDALKPSLGEGPRQLFEQQAVGRHRERAHAGNVSHPAHDLHHVRAHGRLAAGQPELMEAHLGEQPDEQQQLVVLHQLFAGPELHILRHAVDAAQVAPIGQTDAEVVDIASKAVKGHSVMSF